MKTGLSLTELARKIEGNKVLKRDYVVDTSRVTMQVHAGDKTEKPRPVLELPDHGDFPIMPLAHDQIGDRTGIPAKYYDRMLAEAPDLLATNVNAWFRLNPEKRMIRTLGGDTRAFLSNRYQRIENEEIANVALPVLAELPKVQIVSSEITDRRLYIHFVVPTIEGEVKKGDVVQAGGIIQNSEVGCGSAAVSGLLWRLICLNGAKTTETFRRNHVGRAVDEGEMDWSDDTRKADDRTVLLKIRDMVRAVVDETRFKANLLKLQGLTEQRITGDPSKAVEVLAAKLGTADFEEHGILRALIEGGDLSAWGMLNAITAQGHADAVSYDRAVEFEAMGGRLIDLPSSEWKQVLEAA